MFKLVLFLTLFLSIGTVSADNGNPKIIQMLKRNPIVNAAVTQAKKFTKQKKCDYEVKSEESKGFEKGTTFDYSAEIFCHMKDDDGSTSRVRVSGRMFSSMKDNFQPLTLSVEFAG